MTKKKAAITCHNNILTKETVSNLKPGQNHVDAYTTYREITFSTDVDETPSTKKLIHLILKSNALTKQKRK